MASTAIHKKDFLIIAIYMLLAHKDTDKFRNRSPQAHIFCRDGRWFFLQRSITYNTSKEKNGFSFTFHSFALPLACGRKWAALGKAKKKSVFLSLSARLHYLWLVAESGLHSGKQRKKMFFLS
ncbi:MAG: hypothetical protein II681_03690, partial [Bacteroidaceae bacterium]|nr:hypothetical protein [Bacteroidaceae bacterium]